MVVPYSTFKQFVQLGRETTPGTLVAPSFTLPVTKAEFHDKPHELVDKSWTGSMSDFYGVQQGTMPSEFSLSGNAFPDTIVPLLVNVLGDRTSMAAGSATTLSAAATKAATTISCAASVAVGDLLTIDVGGVAETVSVTAVSGTGPYVATVFPALEQQHASGATVTKLNRHAVSLLNSGQGQPATHTFYHYLGPGTNGARAYPGACLSELDFKFNASNALAHYDAKGHGWSSQPVASALTSAPSGLQAMPSWQAVVGINGPAAGAGANAPVMDCAFNLKRKLDEEYTLQGSLDPAAITRGALHLTGKMTVLAPDDSIYQLMRNNTQPALQLILATGSGWIQIDAGQAYFKLVKPITSKTAVEYSVDFDGVINTANAGASGGRSPVMVTVGNTISGASY